MKLTIDLGAYGWRHKHWLKNFYPEDLPIGDPEDDSEDWRLSYYSNEFNAVLVPSEYWCKGDTVDCEGWLEEVHDDFQFFVECHESMLDYITVTELTGNLKKLQPQLSALVFLNDKRSGSRFGLQSGAKMVNEQFKPLIEALQLDIFSSAAYSGSADGLRAINICWPRSQAESQAGYQAEMQPERQYSSKFAIIENDLSDLRLARTMLENFVEQSVLNKFPQDRLEGAYSEKSTIIVNHAQLRSSDLSKFRSVLEIMGY